MTATAIKDLKEHAHKATTEARKIWDAANGEPDGQQMTTMQGHLDEAESISKRAKELERLEGFETSFTGQLGTEEEDTEVREDRSQNNGLREDREPGDRLPEHRTGWDPADTFDIAPGNVRNALGLAQREDYGRAFYTYARRGLAGVNAEGMTHLAQARALVEGTDASGGFLAPTQLIAGVQREAQDLEQLRPRMLVARTQARGIRITREVDIVQMDWVAELAQKPEEQPSFGQTTILAHVGAVVVWVSDELLEDTSFGLEAYLAVLAAEAKVTLEEDAFIAGDGVNKPFGIMTRINEGAAPSRRETASAGTLSGDDLMRVAYSLPIKYRRRAAWVMGTQGILAARLLKDANEQYIFQQGLQAGQPDRLLGYPLIENESAALNNPVAAGNDIAIFGDLRRYLVLDRLALQVKRLEELRAMTDEVGLRFRFRTGGDLQNTAAMRSLRVAAA